MICRWHGVGSVAYTAGQRLLRQDGDILTRYEVNLQTT
jgi:hypothetical protein